MNKTKILITGWLGYIGSHAVVALEEAWYETIIVDNLSNSSIASLDGMESILGYRPIFYKGDFGNRSLLASIFHEYKISLVVHFAALKIPKESCYEPFHYYENNVVGTIELVRTMEQFGIKRIVFSSSAAVYHPDNKSPVKEEGKTGAEHPYAGTKLVCERLLEDLARHADFSVVALRYFNPVGSHPSGKIGETPSGTPASLFPYVLDVASGLRDTVFIYGDNYPTRDGTGIRDYIDINDLVNAHILAVERLSADWGKSWFRTFNLGTEKGTSVLELISAVEKESWKTIHRTLAPRRLGDLAEVYASFEKAKKELWWEPKRTLSQSVSTGWAFRMYRDSIPYLHSMSRNYKLLQVLPYFPPHKGGLEAVAEEISRNLVAYGFADVCNLVFDVGQATEDYEMDGYRVITIPSFEVVQSFPFPKFWTPRFWSALKKAKAFAPDILQTHTRFFLSTLLGWILSKFWNVPWVHIEHGSGFVVHSSGFVAKMAYLYDQLFGKWSIRHADRVVAISEACAAFVQTKLKWRQTDVIYRGFDLKVWSWIPSQGKKIVRFAFVGRLVWLKAVDTFLRVLARLHADFEFSCLIVWEWDERIKLEKLAQELGISDKVEFLGSKPREWIAQELLPNTDIFVNPSLQEGLPTTVIEGLVAGCVVVATDVGGTTEISNLEDLVIARPGDEDDLFEKISFAMIHHARLHGLSRTTVQQKFDARESMRKFLTLYKGLIESWSEKS